MYVDELAGCLPHAGIPVLKTIIHYDSGCLGKALELLDSLDGGTAELSPFSVEANSEHLAVEKKAERIMYVNANGVREKRL